MADEYGVDPSHVTLLGASSGAVFGMLDMLHHHRVGEDEGVWPRVLAKRPDLQPMVDEMEVEHDTLASPPTTCARLLLPTQMRGPSEGRLRGKVAESGPSSQGAH